MRLAILILSLWLCTSSFASYRVYLLKLEHYDAKKKLDRVQYVMSNLDPYQYENYYAGYRWTKVIMIDTWFCPGDTGHYRQYCDRPKVKEAKDRAPASDLFDPKRVGLPYNLQPVIP